MKRFRLLVEYDGTDFAGFQIQGKGERTVQGTLEAAIARLSGECCRIHGAGRTDAGVHATGQVVHFDSDWQIPVEKLPIALNGTLPPDLVVKAAAETDSEFHARYSASARIYRYVILNRQAASALLGRYALHMREPLDLSAMQRAASELVGIFDFAAFGQPDTPGKSTVRQISHLRIRPWKDCLLITVRGNAFLRQMVRAFIGTLLFAGQGKLTADDVRAIRESRDRANCPPVAPAQGLCLVRVEYGGTRPRLDEEINVSEKIEEPRQAQQESEP
jgi:tRNA pseudouridine38-40 synthase